MKKKNTKITKEKKKSTVILFAHFYSPETSEEGKFIKLCNAYTKARK